MRKFKIEFSFEDETGNTHNIKQTVSMNDYLDAFGKAAWNENLELLEMSHAWSITIYDGNYIHECFFCLDNGRKTLTPSHVITTKGDNIVDENHFKVL